MLASLICPPSKEGDNFKLNLFPVQFAFSAQQKGGDSGAAEDDSTIKIDLGKQGKDQRIEDLKNQFKDTKLGGDDDDFGGEMTGQDLLDQMDLL